MSNETFVTNGLQIGSYVVVGNTSQDLKLRTLNMSDPNNISATQDPDILLSDIFTDEATWQNFLTSNNLSYSGVFQLSPVDSFPVYTFNTEDVLSEPALTSLGFVDGGSIAIIKLDGKGDRGRDSSDLLTNVTKPIIEFNAESGLRIFIDRDGTQIDTAEYSFAEDNGKYTVTFDEKSLIDGTYVLKIEDPAGNNVSGDSQAITIETVLPQTSTILLVNDTDTGGEEGQNLDPLFSDRLTNLSRPEINIMSVDPTDPSLKESGLRVFVQKAQSEGSGFNLPIDLVSSDFSFTETSGTYSITFNQDLTDGIYNILLEDDAGNRSTVLSEQTFTVDLTKPIPDNLFLINETDTGFDTSDRLSNKASPEVRFTSEPGLRIAIQHVVDGESGQSTNSVSKEDFSYINSNYLYRLFLIPLF